MKNLFLTFALILGVAFSATAQNEDACCESNNTQGDWYLGTGDISNGAWTAWELSPTVGYAFTDNIMMGFSINQLGADSIGMEPDPLNLEVHARYFFKEIFGYAGTQNLTSDDFSLNIGIGKLFTSKTNNLYFDPRVVYNTTNKTTNLRIGFGLKF